MKFSKETLAIFKNFATINPGIVLNVGNFVMTRSVNGATYAETTIPEQIDSQLAIYDLNAFLSILSLADDGAEIEVKSSGDISIKGSRSEINWPSADPSTIVAPKKQIQFPTPSVTFTITGEDFAQMMRVSRGLGADTLALTSNGSKVVVNAFNKATDIEFKKVLYSFEVADLDEPKEFNFIINIANMKMLPDNYEVQLWAQDHMFAAKFQGEHSTYVLAVESESKHQF